MKGILRFKSGQFGVLLMLPLILSLIWVPEAQATFAGCTPGYWKQEHHFDSWVATGLDPYDSFEDVFGVTLPDGDVFLIEALWARGGGINRLLRHATAALLNSRHPDLAGLFWDEGSVITVVQAAIGFGTRRMYNLAAGLLEEANESDRCPLD